MKVFYCTIFAMLLAAGLTVRAEAPLTPDPEPGPGCSFSAMIFEGTLVATDVKDGFATALKTPDEGLPGVQLSCEGVSARLEVSAPFPVPDDNGKLGPKLDGPFRSFLIYEGKRYRDNQRVLISSSFRNRPISVGMSVENRSKILPAADNYRYQVLLTVTVTEP